VTLGSLTEGFVFRIKKNYLCFH